GNYPTGSANHTANLRPYQRFSTCACTRRAGKHTGRGYQYLLLCHLDHCPKSLQFFRRQKCQRFHLSFAARYQKCNFISFTRASISGSLTSPYSSLKFLLFHCYKILTERRQRDNE